MMRRLFFSVFVVTVCAFAYGIAPFYTAWTIRTAAKAGDGVYLAQKIDWSAIKPGLKASLTQLTLDPDGTKAAGGGNKGLWQRVKNYSTRFIIHNFVDRYANPSGFVTLVTYGRAFQGRDKSEEHLSLMARISRVWSRVRRAEFTSLTSFEMDLLDKDDERRLYSGVFQIKNWQWKLTDLRIRQLPAQQMAQLVSKVLPVR